MQWERKWEKGSSAAITQELQIFDNKHLMYPSKYKVIFKYRLRLPYMSEMFMWIFQTNDEN